MDLVGSMGADVDVGVGGRAGVGVETEEGEVDEHDEVEDACEWVEA